MYDTRRIYFITGFLFIFTAALTAFGTSQDYATAAVWLALGVAFFAPDCRRKILK